MSPNETETETEALTRRQRRAITALLGARTLEAAAQAAGVSRKTLSRWMTKPAFRAALLEAENNLLDAAARRMLAGTEAALDVLEKMLTEAGTEGNRRLAATTWLEYVLKWREWRTLEERLTQLEEIVTGG
jgi:phage terminase small subunit